MKTIQWYTDTAAQGFLGSQFGSIESEKIIIGSLESEKLAPQNQKNGVPTGPYRVFNIFLEQKPVVASSN